MPDVMEPEGQPDPEPDVMPGANCAEAVDMPAFGDYEGDTRGRANDMASQSCQRNSSGGEQVFTFQLDRDAPVVLDLDASSFDTVMSVRTACADAVSEVVCSDDAAGIGLRSRAEIDAVANQRYYVIVDGYNGAAGDVVLRYSGPPDLDECNGVADCAEGEACITGICVGAGVGACAMPTPLVDRVDGTTAGGVDTIQPGCVANSAAPEIVHAFVARRDGRHRASTFGSAFDTVLYVRGGDCVEELDCNDDAGLLETTSEVEFNAVAGEVYYLVVDGYSNRSGAYRLTIEAL
jgi:hypothetical protein